MAIHYATGDLYVADCSNQRIRKVDKHGNVITIAGSSIGDADGNDALLSRFNYPFGITVDQTPNQYHPELAPSIYFTDHFSNRIRALHRHWYDPEVIPVIGELRPDYNCTTVAGSVPGYVDGWGNRSLHLCCRGCSDIL